MKRALPWLLGAALASAATPAAANGRFPQANQIAFDFALGADVVARTTFGVLVSHDRGATFHWVCEQAVGYSGNQDPGIGLFSDGAIAVASFEGLALTHDGGCSWAFVGAGLANEYVIDVAVERASPLRGVAVTSTGMPGGTFHVQAWGTVDGGATWAPRGAQLPSDLLAETIDVAPSDPMRLYVSGVFFDPAKAKHGAVEVSQDGGTSWTRTVVDLKTDASIFIAGVDPSDASRVYARTRGSGKDGAGSGNVDRLLVSKDGGGSFQEVAALPGPLAGFAVSPDGKRVAIGSQGAGLLFASRDDLAFVQVAAKAVQCLAWSPDGLYVCGSDFADGYVIARTTDEGKTFTPLIRALANVGGPLTSCAPGGQYQALCAPAWPVLQQQYGIGTAGGAGGAGGGPGGGAGAVGGAGSGGASTAGSPPASAKSGCSCAVLPARGPLEGPLLCLAGAIFAASRRKRRDSARAAVRE